MDSSAPVLSSEFPPPPSHSFSLGSSLLSSLPSPLPSNLDTDRSWIPQTLHPLEGYEKGVGLFDDYSRYILSLPSSPPSTLPLPSPPVVHPDPLASDKSVPESAAELKAGAAGLLRSFGEILDANIASLSTIASSVEESSASSSATDQAVTDFGDRLSSMYSSVNALRTVQALAAGGGGGGSIGDILVERRREGRERLERLEREIEEGRRLVREVEEGRGGAE